eukprot:6489584-Amphidinium_carterae.2
MRAHLRPRWSVLPRQASEVGYVLPGKCTSEPRRHSKKGMTRARLSIMSRQQAPSSVLSSGMSKHVCGRQACPECARDPPAPADMFLKESCTSEYSRGSIPMKAWRCAPRTRLDVGCRGDKQGRLTRKSRAHGPE